VVDIILVEFKSANSASANDCESASINTQVNTGTHLQETGRRRSQEV
jgi:hypothetical protein